MGLQFRKSKKIGSTKFTIGKSSGSFSIGSNGIRKTFNTNGKQTTSFGIKGIGVHYRNSNTTNGSEYSFDDIQNENGFLLIIKLIWNLIKLIFYIVVFIFLIYIVYKLINL